MSARELVPTDKHRYRAILGQTDDRSPRPGEQNGVVIGIVDDQFNTIIDRQPTEIGYGCRARDAQESNDQRDTARDLSLHSPTFRQRRPSVTQTLHLIVFPPPEAEDVTLVVTDVVRQAAGELFVSLLGNLRRFCRRPLLNH